ncbi:MAG: Bug family tripartite tricarboxylate transporter substrate binding protein [Casimicrobiaceae bacterium]
MRRRAALRALAGGSLLAASPLLVAQIFPGKVTRLIVAFPPGGQSDLIARLVAQALGEPLGVTVVVENRSGASGLIGVEVAAHAPADGSTLLLGSASNLTIAPALDTRLPYDPVRDFVCIGRVARLPLVLAIRAGLAVANMTQLVERARQNPGALTYASGATLVQFAIESLKASAGVDILQVPYSGTAPALQDVLAGRVDLLVADAPAIAAYASAGAVRVIANAGLTRSHLFPNIPTMTEQGFDLVFESWQGLLAPKGTPRESISQLQRALQRALASSEFRNALQRLGAEPIEEPPAAFEPFLREELEKYRRLASARK